MFEDDAVRQAVATIRTAFAQWPHVTALAMGGSRASGLADRTSDIDLYAYVSAEVPVSARTALANDRGRAIEIDNRFWEPGDEWDDIAAGVHVDVMYRSPAWTENELTAVLDRHEARLGYSTSLWHNIRTSKPLFDRTGWFADLQRHAERSYPEGLMRAVVAKNQPVLRTAASSYRAQIVKAAARNDRVSVNHRVAAFLASYFDVLFAINRATHPGEKRLLQTASALACVPPSFAEQIDQLLTTAASAEPTALGDAVDALCDGLDACVRHTSA